ncbi:ABC-2 type transport system ATP-binding protein [Tamaricihabitans halophyticus]|uniref:ABC-2 type transport system ATP-binding protein n=1 Tax=Tamaricihabitans halophyticus TaxID=1262583 RepID=A0A4R2QN96_9PSEU|nr:ATP-binding cassette domain-containing protein [Tamaricihabitans halophyticus]TCP48535.1 ABC-2 type transport system ATP-binding protein [Tamaricihabitans halophyticus]
MTDTMIEANGVGKTFDELSALTDVDLTVRKGEIVGLLGHNGAGKTTLVNILTTMLPPSTGSARVAGFDVVRAGHEVRRRIGLTGQFASVDEQLSGRDNLVLIARLLGASRRQARTRADELLETFELTASAQRQAKNYSGGMRRRLDLAASLVGQPDVLFLDEPTTGLDPVSRIGLWEVLERLVDEGTTVLLTTQYLDEADRLADAITVLSDGRVIASGTAAQLKADVGKRAVHLALSEPDRAADALHTLRSAGLNPAQDTAAGELTIPVTASTDLTIVVRALDEAAIDVTHIALSEPTLDDVYLALAKSTA